jgi:hypothetical protein
VSQPCYDVADEHGKFLPLHEIPVEARTALNITVTRKGDVTFSTKQRVEALKILAQHFDLLQPEPAPPTPPGPATVNFTEIYLDGLTREELLVLKKVLERQALIRSRISSERRCGARRLKRFATTLTRRFSE